MDPKYAWEFIQIGNCGAPILIDEGWLVLTHGVGRDAPICDRRASCSTATIRRRSSAAPAIRSSAGRGR